MKYSKLFFVFFIIFGLLLLSEGNFKISTISFDKINERILEKYNDMELIDTYSKDHVAVFLYKNDFEMIVAECSQNIITKYYSINEISQVKTNDYYSVVSSSIGHYPYNINNSKITIYEKTFNQFIIYSILSIFIGSLGLIITIKEER